MNLMKLIAADFGLVRNGEWRLSLGHKIGLTLGAAAFFAGIVFAVVFH